MCPFMAVTGAKSFVSAVGLFSTLAGAGLSAAPEKAIRLQIAFYRRINWKMEPVSWPREIASTRLMGILALICGIAALAMSLAR